MPNPDPGLIETSFDINSAIPVTEGEGGMQIASELDIHSSQGINTDEEGMTGYDRFVKEKLDAQVHAAIHQPIDDNQVQFILDMEEDNPGAFQSFAMPYAEGVVGFFTKPFGLRPDLNRPFGLEKGPKPPAEQKAEMAMSQEHPIAYTMGKIVSGMAPFLVTAPVFPEGLLGTLGTFETVSLTNRYGQIATEESLMTSARTKAAELGIEAIKSGILAPVWHYSTELSFIGRPFISAVARASIRGAGQASLSTVFGTDLSSALKEGGIITALSLVFESPSLAKTALGRGIVARASKIANETIKPQFSTSPEGLEIIDTWSKDLAKADEVSQKTGILELIKTLYKLVKPRVEEAQSGRGAAKDPAYGRFLAAPKPPQPQGEAISEPKDVTPPESGQPSAGGLTHENTPAPVFYSKLMATIAEKMPENAPPDQVRGIVKSAGISPDEVEISGLEEILSGKEKVGKRELLEELNNNQLTIEETFKGVSTPEEAARRAVESPQAKKLEREHGWIAEVNPEDPSVLGFRDPETGDILSADDLERYAISHEYQDPGGNISYQMRVIESLFSAKGDTKFDKHVVPGGKNYREILLRIPAKQKEIWVPKAVGISRYNLEGLGEPLEGMTVQFGKKGTWKGKAYMLSWDDFSLRIPQKTFNLLKTLEVVQAIRWDTAWLFPYEVEGRKTQKFLVTGKDPTGSVWEFVRNPGNLSGIGSTKVYVNFKPFKVDYFIPRGHQMQNYPRNVPGATEKKVKKLIPERESFIAGHWDEKDVFAHGRATDRTTQDAKSVLFLEEVQSDWNIKLRGEYAKDHPYHPIVKKWLEVLLKRMLRLAAAEGKDYISWANGAQTADHYNLAKYVDEISWTFEDSSRGFSRDLVRLSGIKNGKEIINKGISPEELDENVGKDAADKIRTDIANKVRGSVLTGEDLQVGGHWAINLYDKTIPQWMNDYGKKFGAQVEIIKIKLSQTSEALDARCWEEISHLQTDTGFYPQIAGDNLVFTNGKVTYSTEKIKGILRGNALELVREIIYQWNFLGGEDPLVQQAMPITPALMNALLYEGQPLLGKMPKDVGNAQAKTIKGWEYIFRMTESTEVINTKGEKVTLPKGEEYHTMPVMDSEGNPVPGKVKLQDGKQITVYEGELNKLKGLRINTPSAGGMIHQPDNDIPRITKKDFNQEKAPLPEGQIIANEQLIEKLNQMQDMLGKHLVISSGYRTPEYNEDLRRRGYNPDPKSMHLLGEAADIDVKKSGLTHEEIIAAAQEVGLDIEDITKTPKHVHVEMPQGGASPTPLMEPRKATPEEDEIRKGIEKEIAAETAERTEELKSFLKGKLKGDLAQKGEYADLKHLSWLFTTERGYTPDELVGELQGMGYSLESSEDVIDLIKSYFSEEIQKKSVQAVARADKQARTHNIKAIEYLNKKGMRDLARALRLREIEAAKIVDRIERVLAKTIPASRTKMQIRQNTGIVKIGDLIGEAEALRRLMQREQTTAREAYSAGKKAGSEQQKIHDEAVEVNRKVREAATAEVNDMIADIRKVNEHLGVLPVDYQDAVIELLDQYDLKKSSDKTLAKRDSAKRYIAQMEAEGEEVNIPQEQLDMLEKISVNSMTVDELRDIHDTIMRIYAQGRLKNKLIAAKEARDFEATVAEGQKAIAGSEGIKEDSDMARIIRDQNKSLISRTGESFKNFIIEHIRPEVMIHGLDGWKKGINTQVLWEPIFDAFIKRTEQSAETFKRLQLILKPLDQKNAYTKTYTVGQFKGINKANIYKIYALSFNEKGYESLINSGIAEEDINAIEEFLTPSEKLAIQNLLRYYSEEQYPALDKVYQELNGAHMPKEENYFPIINLESKDGLLKDAENQLLSRARFKVAAVQSGMTKKRVAHSLGFKNMDFFGDVLRNWEMVEHYKAFAPIIRDARKYLGAVPIKEAIIQKFGQNYYNVMQRFIRDVAYGGDQTLLTERDKFVQRLRANYMKAVLSLNILSPIRQTLGVLPAMHMVGKANILAASLKYSSNPVKWWAWADSKSVLLKYRAFTSEREMKEIIARRSPEARLQKYTGATALTEYGMLPLIYADKVICQIAWMAAYDSSIRKGTGEEEAISFANEVVRRTQNMGEMIFLADAFRGSFWDKVMTIFKNENNQNFNLNFENIMKSKNKQQGWGHFIDGVLMLLFIPAILFGWTQRKRIQETAGEALNDILGQSLGGLMYLGDIANAIGGKGDVQANPIASELSTVAQIATGKKPETKINALLKAISFYYGLPYIGLKRLITGQPFGKPAKSSTGTGYGPRGIYQ